MLVNRVPLLQESLVNMEQMLMKPHYAHEYGLNEDNQPIQCTAGRTMRVPENEIPEAVQD